MQIDLSGKVALVTGGSRGIGRAIALGLARAGADVTLSYASNASAADAVVAEITAAGGKAAAVGFDVCVPRLISSRGEFTPALAEALELELERRAREGRAVILIGHYPYAVPAGIRVSSEHRLNGAGRLIEIVARHKPALYLHGHKHIRWALRPAATPETLCVNAGPAGRDSSDAAKRAGFVLIEGALEREAAQGGAEFRAEAFALAPAGVEIARRYRRGEPLETLRDLPFDRAPLAAVSG